MINTFFFPFLPSIDFPYFELISILKKFILINRSNIMVFFQNLLSLNNQLFILKVLELKIIKYFQLTT